MFGFWAKDYDLILWLANLVGSGLNSRYSWQLTSSSGKCVKNGVLIKFIIIVCRKLHAIKQTISRLSVKWLAILKKPFVRCFKACSVNTKMLKNQNSFFYT